jgi:hypothetical protein
MLDNLNPGSPRDSRDGRAADGDKRQRDHEIRPVVEREVPLGQQAEHALASSVHAWLDGELPEAAVRKGETAHDVEFWRGLSQQMERTRRLRTPAHIEAQIMAALPHHAPALITPWYQREFVITPVAAVTTSAAIVAITALVTVVLMAP